jgi:hypothetical protein
MRARLVVNTNGFERGVMATINRVERGTKKALEAACKEVLEMSNELVPRETDTLAESGAYSIEGTSPRFEGAITYGVTKDPINPKSGKPASEYAAIVHEDLFRWHLVGQAKFLEKALLQYASQFPSKYAQVLKVTGL